jgi:hypothetical protein
MKNISEIIYLAMAVTIFAPLLYTGCSCPESSCEEEVSIEMQCTPAPCCEAVKSDSNTKNCPEKKHGREMQKHEKSKKTECTVVCKDNVTAHHPHQMAENMLKAVKEKDYNLLVSSLPEGCTVPVTEEEFNASSEMLAGQFGELTDYTFLTELDTPLVCNQLWKTLFHRKNSEGEDVSQELIFRFVTAKRDGCDQIIGFGFM